MIYRLPNSFGPRTDSPLPSALGRRLGLWTLLPRAGFWSRPRGGSGGEQKRGRRFRFDCRKKKGSKRGRVGFIYHDGGGAVNGGEINKFKLDGIFGGDHKVIFELICLTDQDVGFLEGWGVR